METSSYDPMDVGTAFSAGTWERSPLCGPDEGDCVEVNFGNPGLVAIRDSKLADGPVLVFSESEWDTFTRGFATRRCARTVDERPPGQLSV